MKKTVNVIWQIKPLWGYEWLCELLKEFDLNNIEDGGNSVYADKAVIVTDGSKRNGISMYDYINKFIKNGFRVGCIHLSDECGVSPVDYYRNVNFVFRNYYRYDVSKYPNCYFFALGYKNGFKKGLIDKDIAKRSNFITFIGDIKKKGHSRREMLKHAQSIEATKYFYVTKGWNSSNNLSISKYAECLNDTVFALCPRGFFSVDTFRCYEVLEAGAIPVVENFNLKKFLYSILKGEALSRSILKYGPGNYFARHFFNNNLYWEKMYGKDFPCIRINDWSELKKKISEVDIKFLAKKNSVWWKEYKAILSSSMARVIKQSFSF